VCGNVAHLVSVPPPGCQTVSLSKGVTKRCRLSLLTNSVLEYESKCGGMGRVAGVSANEYVQLCTSRDMEPK
jgi:hypothetical protein